MSLSLIEEAEVELVALEAKISRLRNKLQPLENRRDEIAKFIKMARDFKSKTSDCALDSLPPYILKNPAAVALGKLGGSKGGKTRAAKLTPERRQEIARRAAQKRWGEKS